MQNDRQQPPAPPRFRDILKKKPSNGISEVDKTQKPIGGLNESEEKNDTAW